MTHGDITIEIKSDTLSDAISVRDFLVTCCQVLLLSRLELWPQPPLRPCSPLLPQPFPESPMLVSEFSVVSGQIAYKMQTSKVTCLLAGGQGCRRGHSG